MIVCVAGNPSIDKLFEVGELTVGGIHRPERFVQLPGGKGIHVVQVATALGADAVVTGLLGGHAGRWVAEVLEAQAVQGEFAWTDSETRSSLSVADRETGRLTEFYEDGAPITETEWTSLETIVRKLLPNASWLALAGSLPPGSPNDAYSKFLDTAHQARIRVALDTRGPALEQTIPSQPELVKINAIEASELLNRQITSVEQAQEAAGEIREQAGGAGHAAVVTLGEEGVAFADPDGVTGYGRLAALGRYPVGSGDSFLAGLLVALDAGQTWPQAIALALGAAAANAEVPGGGHIDPDRARRLAAIAEVAQLIE